MAGLPGFVSFYVDPVTGARFALFKRCQQQQVDLLHGATLNPRPKTSMSKFKAHKEIVEMRYVWRKPLRRACQRPVRECVRPCRTQLVWVLCTDMQQIDQYIAHCRAINHLVMHNRKNIKKSKSGNITLNHLRAHGRFNGWHPLRLGL